MADKKVTRLRHISAKSLDEIEAAIEALPFKVEIKGGPGFQNKVWTVSFTLPDIVDEFKSLDLSKL